MNTELSPVLQRVKFPEIGHPREPRPELPENIFAERLARTRQRMTEQSLDALLVYGDREHFANLAWLTNYDPRFEESVLVVFPQGTPILFVGNEGMGYSAVARLSVERRLYQTMSLLGQHREKVRQFHLMLGETGLTDCKRVGAVGWKYFTDDEVAGGPQTLDWPEYLAKSLRLAVGPETVITNETALFMYPENGMRNLHEPEQLAYFEWVTTHNSANLMEGIRALKPGMTELELFAQMPYNGTTLCCSPVAAAGDNLRRFVMPSPTSRKIKRGDPMLMTYSYQGANVCRVGWVARGPQDLPKTVRDYVEKAALPYFRSLVAWYNAFRIDATGNDLHVAVTDVLLPAGFSLGLNCGHQIAMDEWTHSPVFAGSTQRLRSGMYWQSDFFPLLPTAHYGAFAEDGLALADEKLRRTLAKSYPRMWARVQTRRRFMTKVLGYTLSDDVLPFSNLSGAVIPYFLSPMLCPVMKR